MGLTPPRLRGQNFFIRFGGHIPNLIITQGKRETERSLSLLFPCVINYPFDHMSAVITQGKKDTERDLSLLFSCVIIYPFDHMSAVITQGKRDTENLSLLFPLCDYLPF